MADTNEFAITVCRLVQISEVPIPIKLANHTVEQAASLIGAVVEVCAKKGVPLGKVCVDPELALELGLADGVVLPHGSKPVVHIEEGLGRDVLFKRAPPNA
jgi:hypothetical protein